LICFKTRLVNRPALGLVPPADWMEQLNEGLLSVAPSGLTGLQTMMCGACANEHAYKAAFIHYQVFISWYIYSIAKVSIR